MKNKISLKKKIDFFVFGWVINWAYPQYYRPKYNYIPYYTLFFHYFIPQKILRINGHVKWPVHFTSSIKGHVNIEKGIICDPGDNPNIYIQANSKISIGSNVGFGAGTKIISSNHSHIDHSKHNYSKPMVIGNNVFVGANSVLLPAIHIGDNVVIGAGSVVTKSIPSNSIAVGNPCKVIKKKEPYIEDFTGVVFNRKIKNKKFITFVHQSKSQN